MAAEYEVNIKINSQEIERELGKIDRTVAKIGKSKGGGARRKRGIAGLLPSSEELRAAEKGLVQLTAKTKNIQNIQDKFSERRTRALIRSNALNEKELRINKQLTAEARTRLRLLSQAGAKGFDGTRPQGRQMADNINALTNAQEKRARLANKLNEMETKGLNVQKLREKLGKATTEQSARRFASAEKEFRLLAKSIRLEESKLRILKQQQQNFPSSPVRGTRTMMGSPAQIAAAGRQIASPIRGGLGFPGSPAFLAGATASRTPLGPAGSFPQALGGLPTGGAALPIRGSISTPGSPIAVQAAKATNLRALKVEASWSKALGELQKTAEMFKLKDAKIKQSWGTALAELSETAALIQVRSQQASAGLTGQSSPIGGATNIPGSPAFLRRQRRKKTLEQIGLGAGFPLLFGGGAGSVLGGGLGGLTGSFGAQIAFSAIGQQIDQFVAGMVNAGKALTSVGGAADFMAEKSLFSSDSMQFRIEKLIEEGQVTEAAALMTQEMAKQVGGSGLKALKDLGDEANKMGKLFNALILQVQAFISRALTPLLAAINKVVGDVVLNNQFNALMSEATGARAKEIEKFLKPFTKEVRKGAAAKDVVTSEGKRLAVEKFGGQVIPEGAAIEPTGLELLRAADVDSDKAVKDSEKAAAALRRAQEKLQIMQQEGQLAQELKKLDFERAAEIDKINKLEHASTEERQAAIDATENLFDARKGEVTGKALGEDLAKAMELKKAQEDILRPLEDQRRLLEGKLEGNEEEVRLQLEIEKIMRSVKGLNRDDVEAILRKNVVLEEQVKQVERLEQLYQQVGSAIENALVSGIQAAIDGTKSLQSIVSSLLKDVGKMFLQFGIRTALNSVSPSVFPMAQGGFVSSPTRALVGEGGQGEYVIPENKMRESMARYSRGARGSSVIPETGGSGTSGEGGGTAVAAPIDVRYTVERINSVDYVTADQFQRGLQQAAAQGATQGEQRALTTLRQNTSQRRRIGL